MTSVVLVDDHPIVRSGIRFLLHAQPDFTVVGETALGLESRRDGGAATSRPAGRPTTQQHAHERTRAWKRRYRWRAGIEGRVHSLRRDFGLRRCRSHGEVGLLRDMGWGILASNLRRIAQRLGA